MAHTFRTNAESLPIEIWLHVFEEYFTLKELWHSFRDLNTRINEILDQTNLHLTISSFPQNASEYRYNQVLPNASNALNVKSIKVNSLHYVEKFLALHRFDTFSKIRSVHLNKVFVDKVTYAELLDQLASLKHLRSLFIAVRKAHSSDVHFYSVDEQKMAISELTDILVRSVLIEQRIPSLKHLQLHEEILCLPPVPSSLYNTIPVIMKIEHLTVDGLYFDILSKLIPYLQHVKSVRITQLKNSSNNIAPFIMRSSMAEAHAKRLPNCIFFSSSIRLNSNTENFDQIEFLLKMLPAVEQLHLKVFPVSTLNNVNWDFLLSNFCPKLLKLTLKFTNRLSFRENADIARKTLSNSLFWVTRHVRSNYDEQRSNSAFLIEFDLK